MCFEDIRFDGIGLVGVGVGMLDRSGGYLLDGCYIFEFCLVVSWFLRVEWVWYWFFR